MKFTILGVFTGAALALGLSLSYAGWIAITPGAEEGAFDVISALGYLLGFPASLLVDRLSPTLESIPFFASLSSMQELLISIPLSWGAIGGAVDLLRWYRRARVESS